LYQAYLQANESFTSTALYGIITNAAVILFTFIATKEKYYLISGLGYAGTIGQDTKTPVKIKGFSLGCI
jgi:peptidoglycan biosynthesis protein MviN/MurJ (putative lipid II flippase)